MRETDERNKIYDGELKHWDIFSTTPFGVVGTSESTVPALARRGKHVHVCFINGYVKFPFLGAERGVLSNQNNLLPFP